jgi:hypothetical protein
MNENNIFYEKLKIKNVQEYYFLEDDDRIFNPICGYDF